MTHYMYAEDYDRHLQQKKEGVAALVALLRAHVPAYPLPSTAAPYLPVPGMPAAPRSKLFQLALGTYCQTSPLRRLHQQTHLLAIIAGWLLPYSRVLGVGLTPYYVAPQKFRGYPYDDSNFELNFCTASANMRALTLDIELSERLYVKQIAGRVAPAIQSTRALVAGYAMIAVYQIAQVRVAMKLLRDWRVDFDLQLDCAFCSARSEGCAGASIR